MSHGTSVKRQGIIQRFTVNGLCRMNKGGNLNRYIFTACCSSAPHRGRESTLAHAMCTHPPVVFSLQENIVLLCLVAQEKKSTCGE
jgi:hypothetical protein